MDPPLNGLYMAMEFHKKLDTNIPMEKIPIFPGRFLPEDFEEKMEQELSIFTNKSKEWSDIIGTVWDISKCDKIVK